MTPVLILALVLMLTMVAALALVAFYPSSDSR